MEPELPPGPDWSNVPATEDEARALGCTCTWITKTAINHFDDDCPILDRHNKVQFVEW